jgi:hypothetical protein
LLSKGEGVSLLCWCQLLERIGVLERDGKKQGKGRISFYLLRFDLVAESTSYTTDHLGLGFRV